MIKNLKRHKRLLEKEGKLDEAAGFNFFPTTYSLPSEYSIFCEEFKKNSNNVWIMKPVFSIFYKDLKEFLDWKIPRKGYIPLQ